jgi:hypothetical protein
MKRPSVGGKSNVGCMKATNRSKLGSGSGEEEMREISYTLMK